jgi:tRNA-dihydrouridine synthase
LVDLTAVSIPVIVNGDIVDGPSARQALADSGADGVMIGRGVYGKPWIGAQIDAELLGERFAEPDRETRLAIALDHLRESLAFYGDRLGLRIFRKHLAAYVDNAPWPMQAEARRRARSALCRMEDPAEVERSLIELWLDPTERLAA